MMHNFLKIVQNSNDLFVKNQVDQTYVFLRNQFSKSKYKVRTYSSFHTQCFDLEYLKICINFNQLECIVRTNSIWTTKLSSF